MPRPKTKRVDPDQVRPREPVPYVPKVHDPEWLAKKAARKKAIAEVREQARIKRAAKAALAQDTKMRNQQFEICRRVSLGESMVSILTEGDRTLPTYETALQWLLDYSDFAEGYKNAQRARGDVLFEQALDISDNATNDWMARHDPNNPGFNLNGEHIQRSKLRVDTRKWAAAKLNPNKYGDKIAVEGNPDRPVVVAVLHKVVNVVRQETYEEPQEKIVNGWEDTDP